ncbi:hypothetical protein FRACA_370024 [Frankia canadensis]|uniref:Uncharacterized protein n=1 Tax=Frankia canadensis TaxID=1836972 RepID=A0A2I2KVQ4_9ACTN|nr:hypothetical protein FRACA_370024 [Frankia canadensis]SOU57037.1 hypothetical protein FRACA_370024 [Frankia canadensis]
MRAVQLDGCLVVPAVPLATLRASATDCGTKGHFPRVSAQEGLREECEPRSIVGCLDRKSPRPLERGVGIEGHSGRLNYGDSECTLHAGTSAITGGCRS